MECSTDHWRARESSVQKVQDQMIFPVLQECSSVPNFFSAKMEMMPSFSINILPLAASKHNHWEKVASLSVQGALHVHQNITEL